MNQLSERCQSIIVIAVLAKREELQERAAFWAKQPPVHMVAGEPAAAFAMRTQARLTEVEAAIRELGNQLPWLHRHSECRDLFQTEQSIGAVAEVE